MPRRNKRKVQHQTHVASVYDDGFKPECYGCAFAGSHFKCLASDGCLISRSDQKECDNAANSTGANRASPKR